jgi:sugar phosphate isomerase/epimerase
METGRLCRRDFFRSTAAVIAGFALSSVSDFAAAENRSNPIIYFTKFLHGLSPEEIARVVKNIGFDGLDLAVRKGQCVNPDNVTSAMPKAMKIWKEAGLSVPLVSTETGLIDPLHPSVEPIWRACAETGVPNIKIGYWGWKDGDNYWKRVDEARRALEKFGELSEKCGVRTLLHNHSGDYLACNASTAMTLLRDFNPAHVGMYLDPAHLSINGEPLSLALAIVGNHLAMVAVKNAAYVSTGNPDATRWSRRWCLLSEGLVDWPQTVSLLRKRGYSGPLSLHGEYSGPEERELILKNVQRDAEYLGNLVQ